MKPEVFLDGRVTQYCGDVRAVLATLPDDHFDCVVTSPPYWGLRDYGVDGQLGLEASLGEHIAVMVDVFREVRRVLKATGTLWLNYGDSYATSVNGRSAADTKALGNDDRTFRDKPFSTVGPIWRSSDPNNPRNGAHCNRNGLAVDAGSGLKPKDLCGVPWRLAIALQDDGWWLRQDIIWHKPNPMPESIRDRCTKAHEYLFLLTKAERYYFDADAIKEDSATDDPRRPYGSEGAWQVDGRPVEQRHGGEPRNFKGSKFYTGKTAEHQLGRSSSKPRTSGNKSHKYVSEYDASESEEHRTKAGLLKVADVPWERRNKRSVWTVGTDPFPEAHFATFPPALIEPCILAGSPEGGRILDPFGGAGTTALVAAAQGRTSTIIDLNPEYCRLARARIEAAFMGQDEGRRHMVARLGKTIPHEALPLFGGSAA